MARILEALNQIDLRDRAPAAPASSPPLPAPEPEVVPEEIPFIEVGGGQIEASPAVLAARRTPSGKPETKVSSPARASEVEARAVLFRPVTPGCPFTSAKDRFGAELIALHQPEHPASGQYRALLESLTGAGGAVTPRSLLFCGSSAAADSATVALNLAITQARQGGTRVVVVDAAGFSACVAEKVGLPPAPGLQEVLSGAVPLNRALQASGLPDFEVLTAGEIGGRPCLAARSLRATLARLAKRFGLVLVVGPTWAGGSEMVALASACDALYLVVPHDQADSPGVADLTRSIPRLGVSLCGCILAQR